MPPRKRLPLEPLKNAPKSVAAFLSEPSSTTTAPIGKIRFPKKQPRRYFAPEKLDQLAASIKEHGILEPLLVRPLGTGEYELIAGERRIRAAQQVGLTEVPIVVHDLDDKQALQVALMENLQREDLNPVEETEGVLDLLAISLDVSRDDVISVLNQVNNAKIRDQSLKDNVILQLENIESVLAVVGKFTAESFRANRLPLLNLPDEVLAALRQGKIEYTKARAIARVKDAEQRKNLLEVTVAENLSLSEIKEKISELKASETEAELPSMKQKIDAAYQRFKKSKVWDNPKKQKKLEKILAELEALAEGEE